MESRVANGGGFDDACRFVEALARAMQSYGVPSRTMGASLSRLIGSLGLNGEFLATPNQVQLMLWDEDGHRQRAHLAVCRSGGYDLARLSRVMALAELVASGSLRPVEGLGRLRGIGPGPDAYGPWSTALAFVLCGTAFGVILGVSWLDVLLGGAISLTSYAVTRVAGRSTRVAALQEFLAAMIASILAQLAASFIPGTHPMSVTVCAVIWFVPGFGLTVAPIELIAGNTMSGIIWFTNALVAALKLFGGAVIGLALAQGAGLRIDSIAPAHGIATSWRWAAAPALVVGLAVLMRAAPRSLWGVTLGGWLVWGAVQVGERLGFWQGAFLGAAVLMIYAHWFSRRFRAPTIVILLPCVMILVPGLAFLRALHLANVEGVLAGARSCYDVLILVAAIIGGAIVGDSLPRQEADRRS